MPIAFKIERRSFQKRSINAYVHISFLGNFLVVRVGCYRAYPLYLVYYIRRMLLGQTEGTSSSSFLFSRVASQKLMGSPQR